MKDMPQIQQGDIMRVQISNDNSTVCCIIRAVTDDGVYGDSGAHFFPISAIVAIYRFNGRDFKCIWEDGDYTMHKLYKSLAKLDESMAEYKKNMQELNEFLAKVMKKERGAK